MKTMTNTVTQKSGVFINLSNHPSTAWSAEQTAAAEAMVGEGIVDVQFPAVEAMASTSEVAKMAADLVEKIKNLNPGAVMCQGEMSLTFEVVRLLKSEGIKTYVACSNRETVETQDKDGNTVKTAVFRFQQFREY